MYANNSTFFLVNPSTCSGEKEWVGILKNTLLPLGAARGCHSSLYCDFQSECCAKAGNRVYRDIVFSRLNSAYMIESYSC